MRRRLPLVIALLVGVVLVGGWHLVRRHLDRFRVVEVIPGSVLRSSQPAPADLERLSAEHGIRSLINLRGQRSSQRWYQAELAAAGRLGLTHADVRTKLDDWPPRHELHALVAYLDELERPLLLHCKNGTDRSGWAAVIARLLAGEPLAVAMVELSPSRGHVCIPTSCFLHRFFALYEGFVAAHPGTDNAAGFRRWAAEGYFPPPYHAELALVEQPPSLRVVGGTSLSFTVRVTNRSPAAWTMTAGERGIRLGGRTIGPYDTLPERPIDVLRTPNGPFRDVARAGLTDDRVEPGGERVLVAAFPAPETAGRYVLQLDMVDEHVHWFSDLAGPGILIPIEVLPGPDVEP